ncbi:MAG: hypothetical protein ACJ77N_01620 [Chloroflexota bacterium]
MTSPDRETSVRPVQYKGEPLDSERGPGLGCFRFQVGLLAVLVVLTPVSVFWGWPDWLSALLLFVTIALLLVAGQTIIFLLRLVAADRREGRRRPLGSGTATVGEIEDRVSDRSRDTAAEGGAEPPPESERGESRPDPSVRE